MCRLQVETRISLKNQLDSSFEAVNIMSVI